MTTTGRRLEILTVLQSTPGISAAALARRLGVTERPARRDVAHLRDLGYRIDAQAGKHGGYRLASGAPTPALMLDEDELLAVALGLRSTTGVTGLGTAAATALAKVAAIVPARLQHRLGVLARNRRGRPRTRRVARPDRGPCRPARGAARRAGVSGRVVTASRWQNSGQVAVPRGRCRHGQRR